MERTINCLAIAYGVFVVLYLVTRVWRTPTSLAIHASDNMFATLMICTFFVLIPNFKIVAIGFPIGHILGLICAAIFGKEEIYPNSGGAVITTYWAVFLQASIFTTLAAIATEVAFRVIKRSKTKLSKSAVKNVDETSTENGCACD